MTAIEARDLTDLLVKTRDLVDKCRRMGQDGTVSKAQISGFALGALMGLEIRLSGIVGRSG